MKLLKFEEPGGAKGGKFTNKTFQQSSFKVKQDYIQAKYDLK